MVRICSPIMPSKMGPYMFINCLKYKSLLVHQSLIFSVALNLQCLITWDNLDSVLTIEQYMYGWCVKHLRASLKTVKCLPNTKVWYNPTVCRHCHPMSRVSDTGWQCQHTVEASLDSRSANGQLMSSLSEYTCYNLYMDIQGPTGRYC